jgi:hypothetical protein
VKKKGYASAPPPDDDSFESNSYYDPNRGKPGYVQTEDGSWVKKGYYNAAGNVMAMAGGAASVVPPNVLRFIGDNLTDPEAFIPINGSSRSQAILAHTASAMGFALVPQRVAEALAAASGDGGTGGQVPDLRSQVAAIRSTAQQGGDTRVLVDALREEIRGLGAQLRAVRGGGVTFNNVYNTKSAETQAEATTRAQRRQAALGLFGDG